MSGLLVSIIVALCLLALFLWALRALQPHLNLPPVVVTIATVVAVVVCVLYILSAIGWIGGLGVAHVD